MKLYGALIGAFAGYIVGDFSGLLLGALAGFIIDILYPYFLKLILKGSKQRGLQLALNIQQMNLPSEAQSSFFVCTFSMLAKIAQADEKVSHEELQKIEEFIDSHLKLDKKHRSLALKIFEQAFDTPLDLRDYAKEFFKAFGDRVQLVDTMIDILLQVSTADGELTDSEDNLIRSAALLCNISEPHYERLKSKYLNLYQ